MSLAGDPVAIIGAGPTGALLAILLRRRGMRVTVFESRADPADDPSASGRSINLALADRGINALQKAGLYEDIRSAVVPMRGRFVHEAGGAASLQPYGRRPEEVLLSISRHRLNQALLDVAVRRHGVEIKFEHRLEGADFSAGIAQIRDLRQDRPLQVPMQPLLASDGAGSRMRRHLLDAGLIAAEEVELAQGYKELSIPPGARGGHRLAREALHIWPRGGFMLIALPNGDGSFTATLFLPKRGPVSFESLTDAGAVERFLAANFPDVVDLMPDRLEEFRRNPTGYLGTVYAAPWHHRGMTALIGDAAHAIVPFHGQGMNCCFEDCLDFDSCVERHSSWHAVFAEFYANRKPNTDAIAAMALENELEMRAHVADPKFQLQRAVALQLESRYPGRFIPRYAMVMFHHEIPYAVAQQRGSIQQRLLDEMTAGAANLAAVDFDVARDAIDSKLPPIDQARSSVMKL